MNIINTVRNWVSEVDTKETEKQFLNELLESDINENLLLNNIDAKAFYNMFQNEINNVLEEETGYTVEKAINNQDAFETFINSVGGVDNDLPFSQSYKLKDDELIYIVWHVVENEIQSFLNNEVTI